MQYSSIIVAVESPVCVSSALQGVSELIMSLQLILEKCRFIVKLLSGVGDRLVPFIITDMSLRNVDVRNWSSLVRDISSVFYIMGGSMVIIF